MAVTVFHSSLNIVNKLYDYKQSYNYKHTRPNTTPRRVSPSDTEILFSLNIMHPSVEKKIDRVWDCYTAIELCYQPANVSRRYVRYSLEWQECQLLIWTIHYNSLRSSFPSTELKSMSILPITMTLLCTIFQLVPWLSGRTLVFDWRAFAVLCSTYS